MKLIKVLDIVNQIEKSSFLKIIDNISSDLRTSNKEIDKILSECEGEIKNIDNVNIVKLFHLSKTKFADLVDKKLQFNDFEVYRIAGDFETSYGTILIFPPKPKTPSLKGAAKQVVSTLSPIVLTAKKFVKSYSRPGWNWTFGLFKLGIQPKNEVIDEKASQAYSV